MSSVHQLQNTWVLWEHKQAKGHGHDEWANAMREVCEFDTVEDFWRYWSFIPRPSEVFFDGTCRKEVDGKIIDGFSVFKKSNNQKIRPEWEDPNNRNGSDLSCRKTMSMDLLDQHWENIVLAVIGEVMDDGDEICGCRVVDKSVKKGAGPVRPTYRLELWLRGSTQDVADKIRVKLMDALLEGDPKASKKGLPEFEFRRHNA